MQAGLSAPGKLAVVEHFKRLQDCFVQILEIIEDQTLDIGVDRLVHQLHGVLHQGLVLRMSDAGRIYRTTVMLGKGLEVIVDYRLVAVTAAYGGSQIVGDDCHRRTAIEYQGVLASLDQIFLALRPYSLAIGVMAAWQDGHKHFHLTCLAALLVHNLKPVAGIVDIHLVAGIMLHMAYSGDLQPVAAEQIAELRMLIAVGMQGFILLVKRLDGDSFTLETVGILGKQCVQFQASLGRLDLAFLAAREHLLQAAFTQLHQFCHGYAALLKQAHILAHRVAREMKGAADAFYSHAHCVTMEQIF